MDNFALLQSINTLLGLVSPIVIAVLKALLTKSTTPKWVVYLISLVFSILCAVITTLIAGYGFNDWVAIITSIGVIVTTTQTSYKLILNNIGLTDSIVEKIQK